MVQPKSCFGRKQLTVPNVPLEERGFGVARSDQTAKSLDLRGSTVAPPPKKERIQDFVLTKRG